LVIQSVGETGAPLSNTDCRPPSDAVTISKGAHSRPGSPGSDHRRSGNSDSCSPMRVLPSLPAKTLRPSSASRADAVQ
jgi:hypothetical protein